MEDNIFGRSSFKRFEARQSLPRELAAAILRGSMTEIEATSLEEKVRRKEIDPIEALQSVIKSSALSNSARLSR